jgi:chromosome segregation ATPase
MALFTTAATKARIARIAALEAEARELRDANAGLAKEKSEAAAAALITKESLQKQIAGLNAQIATLGETNSKAAEEAADLRTALENAEASAATKAKPAPSAKDERAGRQLAAVEKALGRYAPTNPAVKAVRTAIDATK